jgi:hypothetical protein
MSHSEGARADAKERSPSPVCYPPGGGSYDQSSMGAWEMPKPLRGILPPRSAPQGSSSLATLGCRILSFQDKRVTRPSLPL